ncbi:MAG: hypothetical protein ACK5BO_09980 [Bacteroidota bacterium]|jgi:hypothetical protein
MKNLLLLSIAVSLIIACDTNAEKKEIKADPDKDYTVMKVVEEIIVPNCIVLPSTLNSPASQPFGDIRMVCYAQYYKVKISKKDILITNEADTVLEKYSVAAVTELDYGGAGGVLKSYTEYDAIDVNQQKIKIIQNTGIDSSYSYVVLKENNKVRTFLPMNSGTPKQFLLQCTELMH